MEVKRKKDITPREVRIVYPVGIKKPELYIDGDIYRPVNNISPYGLKFPYLVMGRDVQEKFDAREALEEDHPDSYKNLMGLLIGFRKLKETYVGHQKQVEAFLQEKHGLTMEEVEKKYESLIIKAEIHLLSGDIVTDLEGMIIRTYENKKIGLILLPENAFDIEVFKKEILSALRIGGKLLGPDGEPMVKSTSSRYPTS